MTGNEVADLIELLRAEAASAYACGLENAAAALEKAAREHGRAECCGIGVGGYTHPPECCGDPEYVITDRHGAAIIRALKPTDAPDDYARGVADEQERIAK